MVLLEAITEEMEERLFADIGYSREKLNTDLEYIKEWLKKQHHLPPSRLKEKDTFLKMFLTGCKGDLDTVKRKLDAYYTFRAHSNLYKSRDPLDESYNIAKQYFYFCAVPKIDDNILVRVIMFSLAESDSTKFDMLAYARKVISFGELRLRMDQVCVRDFIVVNCKGSSIGHVIKLKPFLLRDMARLGQEIMPLRYIKAVFINTPSFVEIAINRLIKPLLKKKLKERIIITSGDYEELYEYLDRSCLPEDYGGDYPTLKELSDKWHELELAERDWYINDLSEQTDETKRLSNSDTMKNQFVGFKASFKNLLLN